MRTSLREPGEFRRRMWKYVSPEPNTGCWLWVGVVGNWGYGRIQVGRRHLMAHRFVYETVRGEIPKGLTLDHLCRVRCCVNPEHLEPVTQRENLIRGTSPKMVMCRTNTCKNGHALTDGNSIRYADGKRRCRICKAARMHAYWRTTLAPRLRSLKTP